MMPRFFVLALLALLPLTAQAFEVVPGEQDTEVWTTAADGTVTRTYGMVVTLTVTRPEAPLTAEDLPAALAAAEAHCAAQDSTLAQSDAPPAYDPARHRWTLFAWCETPG